MTRPTEIALAYATGMTPTYTVAEMVECLEDLASDEIPQDRADILKQAAQRLKVTMTPGEIRERLDMAVIACQSLAKLHLLLSSGGSEGAAIIGYDAHYKTLFHLYANGDWPSVLAAADAAAEKAEDEAWSTLIERMATAILNDTSEGEMAAPVLKRAGFSDAEIERYETQAIDRANQMAERMIARKRFSGKDAAE